MGDCCLNCIFWKETWKPGQVQVNPERIAELTNQTVEQVVAVYNAVDDEEGHTGLCRRFPPVPLVWDDTLDARQPHTSSNDWCGEFKGTEKVGKNDRSR